MNSIALLTDSACDLPEDLLKQYQIDMVPLYVLWGGETLRDRVDIQPGAFYERLARDPVHPTTSQPSPQDFAEAFRRARDAGASEIVLITISSAMSSTFGAARQGAAMADIPVHIVDSRANSMSQGWQVLAAARVREAGGGVREMLAAAEEVRRRSVTTLYVDTLEYLHKGGRIGRAAAWLGAILDLKPLLYVDHDSGAIEPGARTRTRDKAIEKLIETFFSQVDPSRPLRIGLLHGNIPEQAQQLAERIRQTYKPAEMIVSVTSPVLGVHTGPGALALCGYSEG